MWLECIGVVSGCCYKEAYRFPYNPYFFVHLFFSLFSIYDKVYSPLVLIMIVMIVVLFTINLIF